MPKLSQQFQTIHTEGALLPSDILQRIASLKVEGIRPADYHLPEGFRVNEAVTQSWDILKKHWKNFKEGREKLAATDHGTALTNERWLLPLFKELEYGRLSTVTAPQIEERTYPIERFYNHTPIHLIGCNLPLDKRTKGARGAATSSPHSMLQEFLNRSDTHLWGFLSNGLQLRLMRDSVALSRQAFVEFDLEGMMDGEVYGDFVLLWLLCHQSRVESERPENCWLEQWSKLARDEGTRVLNNLRIGVTKAIEALGQGFIAHSQNDELRSKLQESGTLSKDDFYRQLLRTVYRLLFLFVAEDRELLHPPAAGEQACQLYDTYYSTRRLREMAFKLRGSKHYDLWYSLSLVFGALNRDHGLPELGLPGLGSFLWENNSTPDILGPGQMNEASPAFISNDDLLTAIRAIAYVEQDKVLRSVDYRNLGTEEFGSVYESLLELHPVMHVEAKTFSLNTAAGNERKTSGSYYTPDSLVQCLLDSALEPVVDERLKGKKGKEAEDALQSIKVCDPACGSGHFLISAAHRLARHLARIRTGESEPSPEDYQRALRDVIGRCLYGVDINPMAVELCKVSLWMEALEPGKPLSFLDYHIQVGNSLLGTTPALLALGIPDDAFTPIEGDVKARVTLLKRQNKKERDERKSGQKYFSEPFIKLGDLAGEFARLTTAADETMADVAAVRRQYCRLVKSSDYASTHLMADTWCAAFVWQKDDSELGKLCPTELDYVKVESHAGMDLLPHVRSEVERLQKQYQFFHWHLAFPDVFRLPGKDGTPENEQAGWNGGFDVMLGNPPWDKVQPEEESFFASSRPDIAIASGDKRKAMIARLHSEEPSLYIAWVKYRRQINGTSQLVKMSGRFPLSAEGNLNTYRLFAELFAVSVSNSGFAGVVVQSGLATDDTGKDLFDHLFSTGRLRRFLDFENTEGWFPNVHAQFRFALMSIGPPRLIADARTMFGWMLRRLDEVEHNRWIELTPADLLLFNPVSRTCPVFSSKTDYEISKRIYKSSIHVFASELDRFASVTFLGELYNMTRDSECFETVTDDRDLVPLYESKLIHQFDHRFASYSGDVIADNPTDTKVDPHIRVIPRYWVSRTELMERCSKRGMLSEWMCGFRDISNPENVRTSIVSLFPRSAVGNNINLILNLDAVSCALLAANANAFAFDYCCRQKVAGKHLNIWIFKQLPVISRDHLEQAANWFCTCAYREWLLPRILELAYTAWDLEPFARDSGYSGPPFRWDEDRRFLLRAEVDAAFFHLYGINRDDAAYILDTFPIVARKDIARTEVKDASGKVVQPGTYITKDTILEIYDAMAESIRTGYPYQTRLNPPPADPRVAHPDTRHSQSAGDEQVLEFGRLASYVVLFLRACNRPAARNVIEAELVLMLNDAARRQILNKTNAKGSDHATANRAEFVRGFDGFLNQLVALGFVLVEVARGVQTIRLGSHAPETDSAPAEDLARLKETVKALEIVGEDRARDLLMEMVNERYAFVS